MKRHLEEEKKKKEILFYSFENFEGVLEKDWKRISEGWGLGFWEKR